MGPSISYQPVQRFRGLITMAVDHKIHGPQVFIGLGAFLSPCQDLLSFNSSGRSRLINELIDQLKGRPRGSCAMGWLCPEETVENSLGVESCSGWPAGQRSSWRHLFFRTLHFSGSLSCFIASALPCARAAGLGFGNTCS